MTNRSSGATTFVRVVLAAVVILDLFSFYFFLGEARLDALAAGAPLTTFSGLISQPAVRGAVIFIGIAGAVAFARRPGRLWEGLVALASLTLLSTAHTSLFGSPWRHLFFGGLCLAGWLVGLAVRRYQGAPTDESYAHTGAIALLGAAYLNSGVSKLAFGGLTWISGLPVQSAVVAQSGLVPDGLAAAYRHWVVMTPALASVFSTATALFELSGPLMLVSRPVRSCVALGLFAMHANIFVLTGHILYWESMVLLLSFGLAPSPVLMADSSAQPALLSNDRRFATAVVVLAACAVLGVGHQARRYAQSFHHGPTAAETLPEKGENPAPTVSENRIASGEQPLPTATVRILRQVGPFAVGQTLAGTWSVDSLVLSDDGFTLTVSGKPGRARFDLTCSSPHDSPFDVGAAHILYRPDMDFRDLETVGRAVQEQFRKATEGRDVCERLLSWRTAAQSAIRE